MSADGYALTSRVRARAELTVEPGPVADCLRWRCAPPIVLRQTGPHRVHVVQAAGGPLGGDELALDVNLGAGACVQMRSAAAMVVQAGGHPAVARWTVAATLGAGAALDWQLQPTVVCDGAELHSQVTVALQRGACAVLREEVVLGRAGQRGGRFVGELAVELEGAPLLAHTMLLGADDSVLAGPAGTGGACVMGMLAMVGVGIDRPPEGTGEEPGLRWAWTELDGPGYLLLALGDRVIDVSRLLDQAAQDWPAHTGPERRGAGLMRRSPEAELEPSPPGALGGGAYPAV